MGSILIFTDIISLVLSFSIALLLWNSVKKDIIYSHYLVLLPFLLLFIVTFSLMDLYPAIGLSPITESKAIYISTTTVFLILGALSFVGKYSNEFSRGVFFISWVFCLLLIPFLRQYCVKLLCKNNLWGDPVCVIGFNIRSQDFIEELMHHPEFGLNPKIIVNFIEANNHAGSYCDIPIVNMKHNFKNEELGKYSEIRTVIVIPSQEDQRVVNQFLNAGKNSFSRAIIIPERQVGSLWVKPFDINGLFGYEIKQNLLSLPNQFFKRSLDLFVIILFSPVVLLISLGMALMIKLDSNGPVFFREERIGFDGKTFRVWKFRTMVVDADLLLNNYLHSNSELAQEWETNHKLKNDPRITQVGRFLRRWSLDEFPQIMNVLKNEMSLVGPRPIVKDEIHKYGERFDLYKKVKPGMSGLWQISGRNDLSYDTRVDLDEYYVRNYSIWIDFYIIRKTFSALISNKGAY
jgi:Undecaprenyl-phosphate galactose phosphotransferase WbaP